MNPVTDPKEYDSWGECGMAGYKSSIELLNNMKPENINSMRIYIGFTCKEINSL